MFLKSSNLCLNNRYRFARSAPRATLLRAYMCSSFLAAATTALVVMPNFS